MTTTLEAGTTREVAGQTVVTSYGNDAAARAAYHEGAALANRSHWGLLRLTGSTRLPYLHNQTTNDMNGLQAGQSRETIFLTATARVIDLVTALATEEAVWLLVSPERRAILLNWMPRFIFFTDDVQVHDESDDYAIFSLLGPQSRAILADVSPEASDVAAGEHRLATVAGVDDVRVAGGGGLLGKGVTLLVPEMGAATVWRALRDAGAEPMGTDVWEALRIEQGRPAADREMTEQHNPLEAGLWDAISFSKGCYIGQEVVARLDTYQKLKQQLWGLRPDASVQPGTPLRVEGAEVGIVTSAATTPDGPVALGYIRTKAGGAGLTVRAGDATAEVVDLPFASRGRHDL